MKNKSIKLIIAIAFIAMILGMGALFYQIKIKGHKTVKKQGYRTEYNPSYLDSMVRARKSK